MTIYEIPDEPEGVDVVWTRAADTGLPEQWERRKLHGETLWRKTGDGRAVPWLELLMRGPIHDRHPDLDNVPPTPWRVDSDDGTHALVVVDATGTYLFRADQYGASTYEVDERLAAFVVRAVNGYAEQLGAATTEVTAR